MFGRGNMNDILNTFFSSVFTKEDNFYTTSRLPIVFIDDASSSSFSSTSLNNLVSGDEESNHRDHANEVEEFHEAKFRFGGRIRHK